MLWLMKTPSPAGKLANRQYRVTTPSTPLNVSIPYIPIVIVKASYYVYIFIKQPILQCGGAAVVLAYLSDCYNLTCWYRLKMKSLGG